MDAVFYRYWDNSGEDESGSWKGGEWRQEDLKNPVLNDDKSLDFDWSFSYGLPGRAEGILPISKPPEGVPPLENAIYYVWRDKGGENVIALVPASVEATSTIATANEELKENEEKAESENKPSLLTAQNLLIAGGVAVLIYMATKKKGGQ